MLDGLAEAANANEAIRRLGRHCTTDFMIEIGDTPHHVSVDRGRVVEVATGPFRLRPWSFAVRASEETWREFWRPLPAPGFQDVFAMTRFGHARLEGDLAVFRAHLRFFKEILALPRGNAVGGRS